MELWAAQAGSPSPVRSRWDLAFKERRLKAAFAQQTLWES